MRGSSSLHLTNLVLDIANRAGAHGLFTFTMGNGYVGYIATRAAYEQGGYESGASRFSPGCGEALADIAVRLLTIRP
mgnify:CR=1 FL=1